MFILREKVQKKGLNETIQAFSYTFVIKGDYFCSGITIHMMR